LALPRLHRGAAPQPFQQISPHAIDFMRGGKQPGIPSGDTAPLSPARGLEKSGRKNEPIVTTLSRVAKGARMHYGV